MSEIFDALIIGGGPAGASAAILLAQAGWQVAVVEKKVFPRRKVCGEFISGTSWPMLRALGVAPELLRLAGPAVRRIGVYTRSAMLCAELPSAAGSERDEGRALGREHLDTVLLRRAATLGAQILQPCGLDEVFEEGEGYRCQVSDAQSRESQQIRARLLIAAHGSWESGPLPTQQLQRTSRDSDLFGFKAHFLDSALPADLMPLIAFPGGYGGMVHSDGGRSSLSCCIRRDELARCRQRVPHVKAGEAVLAHIRAHCAGAEQALAPARLDGSWLSAGPLRTGIRSFGCDGIVAIGNAAAEAHPIIAEGISMAVQSAFLLCTALLQHPDRAPSRAALAGIRSEYEAEWRRNFSRRLHVSALLAHLFMRPLGAAAASFALQQLPQLLTMGARWSGKAQPLRVDASATARESVPTRH